MVCREHHIFSTKDRTPQLIITKNRLAADTGEKFRKKFPPLFPNARFDIIYEVSIIPTWRNLS
ncbi:MAG: hypothetical protein A2270_00045 [Elusimicrobia bacterium RIFOXYA12_FULL_51_18]|nr:MAG: hypothetical protein A2270_00045 [Elusimicrobia bacterium RIFOXYA12_FULL_51_18]OGS32349.1 MAG: hypothetical protein A2218_03055 [Elusimicrobia bacterium RIFOXYA2_FULL_53_38]